MDSHLSSRWSFVIPMVLRHRWIVFVGSAFDEYVVVESFVVESIVVGPGVFGPHPRQIPLLFNT